MMLLSALSVLLLYIGASSASCSCSSLVIPVDVDVLVPKDPTDMFAGLKSNASSLRRVSDTYDIYGVFCRPEPTALKNSDVLQLLVHGFSYTNQYWSPGIEEFNNYSYTAFSCDSGLSSFAIDSLGAGLSSRPANASDVQLPTGAAVLSQLGHHLKSTPILPGLKAFTKIIGIGHSAGSGLFNFGAIVDGVHSPFAGLILTGLISLTEPPSFPNPPTSARDVDPIRWGTLDPAYITTDDRAFFYPSDTTAFSPRMLAFDAFTKDVGTVYFFTPVPAVSIPAAYFTGRVAKVVGSEDQLVCTANRCTDVAALTAEEGVLWPAAASFELVVSQGSGHDLNLDFLAQGVFRTLVGLVERFST
ncbi:hypothetical protein DFH09DRAFT_1165010 [Mycena vulgaris]|nr:hypothetical protein DFH09DRAFT_1165010 [Mycena vulgaris]